MPRKKMRFYLAHPLSSRTGIRAHERDLEREHRDLELINPFYDSNREDIEKIDKGLISRWKFNKKQCKKIVEGDVQQIVGADGVLAVIDGNLSYGTIMELVYAKMNGKIIVMLVTNGTEKHPWFRYHADIIVKRWDKVYDAIKKVYDKKNS